MKEINVTINLTLGKIFAYIMFASCLTFDWAVLKTGELTVHAITFAIILLGTKKVQNVAFEWIKTRREIGNEKN